MKSPNYYQDRPTPGPWLQFWISFRRNKAAVIALVILIITLFLALFGPFIAPYDPARQFSDALLRPPAWHLEGTNQFLLGTDDLGRDLLSRLLAGARLTLGLATTVVILALVVGVLIGAIAAYARNWLEDIIMRAMDILLALPSLLLAIVIVAILGPGLPNAIYAVSIVLIPHFARVTRAAIKEQLSKDYVLAARLDGARPIRLLTHSVLPNVAGPIIVQTTLSFSTAVLDIAALGFLGLGAQPPNPEWGTILSESRDYIQLASWTVTLPGLSILVTVLSINLVGDGLRDALDPRTLRM